VKRALTLRGTLRLLGLGAMAYVAIIAVVIAVRIVPTAIALRRYSERMLDEYSGMQVRTQAFHATIEDIHPLLIAVVRGASPAGLRPRLTELRRRVDSLSALASGAPALSGVPTEMRLEFAGGSVAQSDLEVALTEALANLVLGRAAVAGRRLQAADSIARVLDRHVAEAQRLGLVDLIRRESALADATTASLRAIGWWLGLGIVVAPFFVTFLRRRFYDPLSELDRGLARVARGDLEGMIPVLRQDELGRLSGHFNETTALLRRRAEETRRHAQAALRESQERYEAIVEFAPLGIGVVDPEGRYLHANPALEHFLGYSEGELRGKTFADVTIPADVSLTTEPFREMLAGSRDHFHVEKRYLRKDGAVVWGRLMVAAVRDDTGKLIHTVSMTEDVTEERRQAAEASEVEERLRREQAALVELARHTAFTTGDVLAAWRELTEGAARTLNVARVGIWLFDGDGSALRCNDLYDLTRDRHSAGADLTAEHYPTYFRALQRDRVIAASDGRTEPRTAELSGAYLIPLGITSMLDAPIRVGGRVAGVVCHEHVGTPREWTPAEQSFAGSIADLAALALEAAERARTGVALRKSEEKFATAFRLSPNPSVIARVDNGLMVDANAAYLEATGFTRDEVIGKAAKDVLWPVPAGRDEMMRELKKHGRLRHQDLKMRTKSGPFLDVLVSVEIIDIDGVPHTLGSAIDITERNRVAEALRESEQRFRRLVQDLSVGVALLDGAGRVLMANPAAIEMLGVTPEDIGKDGFWQRELTAIHEDGTPYAPHERPVLNAVRTGTPLRDVVLGHRPRGEAEMRWVIVNVDPQRDGQGVLRNVIVSFSDITERKRAEQQLRLLALAVESTTEAITITDLEDRFTFVNGAFLEQAGYTGEELIGRHVSLMDSPRNPPSLRTEILAATAKGGWSGELYNRRKDGTDIAIALTTAQVRNAEGRVIALMGVASDVTERKWAQEQAALLQESLRRAETMSALGAVVAGVAHEVRNPLFAISATVDALEARFGPQPAYARYTETLRQEVNRLSRLMSDLLDYGRPPRLDLTDTAIGPVVTRALAACAPLAEQAGVQLAADLADDLPLLPLDPARMLQVLQNLIDNAIQHSPRSSQVVVRAVPIAAPNDAGIEVTVADQGPGIRAEDVGSIFEPFFTRRRGGTGLGLSIVQRIVEQHGGEVTAENPPTGGALIRVRLCRPAGANA
jgi:PAS domain S-box-containing protein